MPQRILALGCLIALAACYDSSGLAEFGAVQGYAHDASTGVALAGVAVRIDDATATTTAPDGTFRFERVRPGAYDLIATFTNFSPFHAAVTVRPHQNTAVALLLSPGEFAFDKPAAIAAEPGPNRGGTTVAWAPLTEAVTYALYWSTSPDVPPANANRINGVTSPFAHQQLDTTKTYYYAVAGIGFLEEGPLSATVFTVPYNRIAIRIESPQVTTAPGSSLFLSVRVLSDTALSGVTATLNGSTSPLVFIPAFFRWERTLDLPTPEPGGSLWLTVTATDVAARSASATRQIQ